MRAVYPDNKKKFLDDCYYLVNDDIFHYVIEVIGTEFSTLVSGNILYIGYERIEASKNYSVSMRLVNHYSAGIHLLTNWGGVCIDTYIYKFDQAHNDPILDYKNIFEDELDSFKSFAKFC